MTKFSFVLAVFAGMAVVPTVALAMEPYLPKSPKSFGRVDADSNGRVTAAELAPRAEKRILRLDGDRDGEVSAAEIDLALKQAVERRRDRIMATLDGDKNGRISKAELDSFVANLVEQADTDHDGGVTLAEARNYRVAKRKKPVTEETAN